MRMRCVFDGAVELLGLNVRLDDLVVRKRPLGACENRICYIHSSKIIHHLGAFLATAVAKQ